MTSVQLQSKDNSKTNIEEHAATLVKTSTLEGESVGSDKDHSNISVAHSNNDNQQSKNDSGEGVCTRDNDSSLLSNSSPPSPSLSSSLLPSRQNEKGETGSCSKADGDVVNLESGVSPVVSSSSSSSSNTVVVKHGSETAPTKATATGCEGIGAGTEAVTYAVLSSSTPEQQDGSDTNRVVLDNCNSYCSLKNGNSAFHPKTNDASSSSSVSNGEASDATKSQGSNPDSARTISLLAERLAEDEDKKLKQVVNGKAVPSPDHDGPVKQESSCPSPCSHCQHSSQTADGSVKDVDVTVMDADERKLFNLKQIAQEQFKAASKTLTEPADDPLPSAMSHQTQKATNGSAAASSSVSNSEDKQQSIPIAVTNRKTNGYTQHNGHGSHINSYVEISVSECNKALSADTLVGDLDDALRESPHQGVPVDQMLGINTRGDGGSFYHHSTPSSTTTTNTHQLSSTRRDVAVGSNGTGTGGRCNGCGGGQDFKRTSTPNGKVKMVKNCHPATNTASFGPGIAAVCPNKAVMSRRARTASGASSRDLSVSPSSYSSGNWSDTGRLRHTSGGESSAMLASTRRSIAASVSTSTTDISDSCVGKIPATTVEKQTGNVRQHLDVDSLTLFSDHRQDLLSDLVSEKDRKIAELESRLGRAIDYIRANRNRQFQQQQACPVADEFIQNEPEGGEHSSLGTISNPASDTSWEQLDETEERVVLWVPDDVVTHCAGCDKQFYFYRRKHHCRNCGKIFCYECRNYLAPMPNVYMKEPQRVCRRCHSRLMQLSPGASCDGRIPTLVADG